MDDTFSVTWAEIVKDALNETARLQARVEELEEAITNASILICHSQEPYAKAAMRVFGEVNGRGGDEAGG